MKNTNLEKRYLKTYADRTYKHTTMVRHNGTLIAFAMDQQRRIYYTVLNLNNQNQHPIDAKNWLTNPAELQFPTEIAQVGFAVAGEKALPLVKIGGQEVGNQPVRPQEIDRLRSTTARFTADAPFQVISDNKYVYLCRQAIDRHHPDMVFAKDAQGQLVRDAEGNPVPIVNETLLVDRFVLVGTELRMNREARYRRSRSKSRPLNAKDTLGSTDMNNLPFFEPTQELNFVEHLQQGRFTVLLLPTQIADVKRWQIFAANSQTGHIDSFNVERSQEGLFNLRESVLPTDAETPVFTGMTQMSFHLKDWEIASGLSALLYFQQESMPMPNGTTQPMKQNARVLLVAGTHKGGETLHPIAALDFAVTKTGQLAQVPEVIDLALINSGEVDLNTLVQRATELEAAIPDLMQEITQLQGAIAATNADIVNRENQRQSLIKQRDALNNRNAGVQFYTDYRYKGASFKQNLGFHGDVPANFNDRVRSLKLDSGIAVTVYRHGIGASPNPSTTYTADVPYVAKDEYCLYGSCSYTGNEFTDAISAIKIENSPQFAAQVQTLTDEIDRIDAELVNLRQLLMSLEQQLMEYQQLLMKQQMELEEVRKQLRGDTAVPMPLVHIDSMGMTVTGGLLEFAQTNDNPQLFESATGKLALYFRGEQDEFCATYYDTSATRASYLAMDSQVYFMARTTGSDMANTAIAIQPGGDPDTCTVTLRNPDLDVIETWQRVPRDSAHFATVLNGQASQSRYLGRLIDVQSGLLDEIPLSEPIRRPITSGSAVLLGNYGLVVLRHSVPVGATILPIEKTEFATELPAGDAVYLIEYNYAAYAATTRQPYDLQQGSLLIRTIAATSPGSVRDTTDADIQLQGAALSTRWIANPPGNTIAFHAPQPNQDASYLIGAKTADQWAIQGDGTFEAWVKPTRITAPAQIIDQHSPNSRYTLSLQPEQGQSALQFGQIVGQVRIGGLELTGHSFTIEFWAKRELRDRDNTLISQGVIATPAQRLLIGFKRTNQFTFSFPGSDLDTSQTFTDAEWHHWACTYDTTTRSRILYRDGVAVAQDVAPSSYQFKGELFIGTNLGIGSFHRGAIDELRIWNRVRSASEIVATRDNQIDDNEPGLIGYWSFENLTVRDRTSAARHGAISGSLTNTTSPIVSQYSVITGVNRKFVRSQQKFTPGDWNHFAIVYDESYALRFDGVDDYLDCGNSTSLNLGQEMTIELTLQPNTTTAAQGLLSKGIVNSSDPAKWVPYALYLTAEGGVGFAFTDDTGRTHTLRSPGNSLPAGAVSRVAVTRKKITETSSTGGANLNTLGIGNSIDRINLNNVADLDNNERDIDRAVRAEYVSSKQRQRQLSSLSDSLQQPSQPVDLPTQTQSPVQEWLELKLYINGRVVDSRYLPAVQPATNDQPLEIGRASGTWQANTISGTAASYFNGVISEVRCWNTALPANALHGNLSSNEQGLISWWRFEDSTGSTVDDAIGPSDATVNGATWIADPDPNGSTLVLHHNGVPIEISEIAPVPPLQANQFSLGRNFEGNLDEVRIWRTARTEENILDNLFSRLKGEKEDLVAYYTFDRDHAEAELQVRDHSLRGNALVASNPSNPAFRLKYILSTAPIADDAAIVRNALAGIQTRFQDVIHSRPVVEEYGDLQYNAMGDLVGSQKRCYSFIKNGQWYLLTGFKVGNLVSEWVSQVQYDPQVMGYIEGAPPVPGENLTESAGDDFTAATSLEIVEAENVTYTISSEKESGFDTSLSFAASIGVDTTTTLVLAPLGIGILQDAAEVQVGAQTSGRWDTSQGWSSSETQGHGINTSRHTAISLSGSWEDPEKPQIQAAYDALGRRYIPANVGFAVVQSETADVFALRLAHNQALVAYRIRPNRDIPRDVNLIPFPINPYYTKQGTLDGAIGISLMGKILDPDYPNAAGLGEYSYFKPREAYALRNRIQQEEQRLKTFYENFTPTTSLAQANQGSLEVLERGFGSGIRSTAETLANRVDLSNRRDPYAEGYAKRNLVNTYVWTAEGGFYAESTETATVKQETTGSSYSTAGAGSLGFQANFNVFGADVGLELSAEVGAQLTVTKTVAKDSETSFGITVSVNPPGDTKTPGKVDAYRFFTFSLEPSPENCDRLFHGEQPVIDPRWLAQSNHPNAVALRQANNAARKPPCWRVFHRVTFVSRILPELPDTTEAPMEAAIRAANIESNWLLIQRLDPFVRNKTDNFGVFADAVRNAIRQVLPELQPHDREITEYLALYYGIADV
jgi:hypothetical protein